MERNPRLRPLEPIPVDAEGQQLVILRDPMRFVAENATVGVPVYLLLTLMDGSRSIFDLQKSFKETFGGEVSALEIEGLVADLDKACLLDNERFEELRRKAIEEFRALPARAPSHAGSAYEGSAEGLRAQIDAFHAAARRDNKPWRKGNGRSIRGIVAPHIDPRTGGKCAAHAYAALAQADPAPELFVLFGTAHQPGEGLFALTEKSFDTPLGRAEVDRDVARALRAACPLDLAADEYLHKYEHSIEFQVIFLQHLFGNAGATAESEKPLGDRHTFQILPVLVGSFHEYILTNTLPSADDEMRAFTGALRDILDASGKRYCCVTGADLSHMGKKFGDAAGISDEALESTRAFDREILEHVEAGRREEFFRSIQCVGDSQKVCGLPPMYAMMELLGDGCKADLLDYGIYEEHPTESFVSYAGMVCYDIHG